MRRRRIAGAIVKQANDGQAFQATDVELHLLPAGGGFLSGHAGGGHAQDEMSPALRSLVQLLAGGDAVDTANGRAVDPGRSDTHPLGRNLPSASPS